MFRKLQWWKIVGMLLVLYALIVGMLVPLKTGIESITPSTAVAGKTVQFRTKGYNTTFQKDKVKAWLKTDEDFALAASKIEVLSENQLDITFDFFGNLPSNEKVKDFTLILNSPEDGSSVLPSAVFLTRNDTLTSTLTNVAIEGLTKNTKFTFPFRNILGETIRNTYYHVPLWFGMFALLIASVVYSIRYLRFFREEDDQKAMSLVSVGILYGCLGLLTGAVWAKNTWGAYWSWDVKQNMAAIAVLLYFAYNVLRGSFDDQEKRARLSAVYNIFAFAAMIPLIFVIPRMTDSLHPGNGGNPAIGSQDLDNTMRMIFYPACIGFIFIGFWMSDLYFRYVKLKSKALEV